MVHLPIWNVDEPAMELCIWNCCIGVHLVVPAGRYVHLIDSLNRFNDSAAAVPLAGMIYFFIDVALRATKVCQIELVYLTIPIKLYPP